MTDANANAGNKDIVMDATRLNEASEWFVRLREAAVTNEVITAWLQWCNAHPDNAHAYRQVQEIWSLAKDAGISEWPAAVDVASDAYTGDVPIAEWKQKQAQHERQESEVQVRPRRVRPYLFAAAASVALAIGSFGFMQYWSARPSPVVYETERAAKREVRLADGSAVSLGGASTIRVTYRADRRDIELASGEAYFRVTPDKTRPFVVRVQDVRVTAVGTAFTVRADDARTVVSVTDGIVEVADAGASSGTVHELMLVRAGEQVTYDAQRRLALKHPSDETTALGWQGGALSYLDEPLRSVIARVNRNTTSEIVLTDPGIGELRFTGTVHESQVAEWAVSLERVFPVRVIAGADGRITLEPR